MIKEPIAPKYYANVCDKRPKDYSDYEHFKIPWGNQNCYEVVKKIGRGKYSEVFDGLNIVNNQRCIIKILKPIKKAKIKREIKILHIVCTGPNIVTLYDIVKDPITKTPSLIFEAIDNTNFRDLYPALTDFDVRYYVYRILEALDYCHSQGIMHRDIKPQNLVVDHKRKILKVIDWGLAEFYRYGQSYNVRVASRYYKGPELLTDDIYYNYSLDIWSLGCVLAEIIFNKIPFFKGKDNFDQLVKIVKILGTDELVDYVTKYELSLSSGYDGLLDGYSKIPFESFVKPENKHLANPEALNLLNKMLLYDKEERIAAKDAILDPYFDPVRKHLKAEPFQ